jgi:hypothetical protein
MGQIGDPTTPAHHLAQVLLNQVGMQWNSIVGYWTEGPRPKGGTAPKGLLLLVMADFCEQLDEKS